MNHLQSPKNFIESNKSQYDSKKLQIGNLHDVGYVKELDPLMVSKIKKQAQSIACMILSKNLEMFSSGKYRLCKILTLAKKTESAIKDKLKFGDEVIGAKEFNIEYGNEIPFGENEAFYDEPAPGYGTAFFIGGKFAITAAHCVCLSDSDCLNAEQIENSKIVFNFQTIKKTTSIFNLFTKEKTEVTFDESEVFGIKRVVCHKFCKKERKWADWALLELDREVTGREPLEISYAHISEAQMNANEIKLYMLGHPSGLSIKLTKNGIVTETKQPGYFSCHLDAFTGNSGSPVFDFKKQKIIGILNAGGEDYEITNNYRNSKKTRIKAHCVTKGHEKCQRMSSLLIELERNGALNERSFPENEIENFLIALKNNYKGQKNILRLLHKNPLPINVVYTQLVLLQNISKKIEDEEINSDNKNNIRPTIDKNFKQIYKERGISSWEDIRTSKKPIDLKKLFEKSENQNSAPKQLLIMGKAGVGKSTLCQHIAYQWADGKLWNEKFDALFWVPLSKLQEIEPDETVASFLFRACCLGNHELYPCEIMDYLKNNREKVLFVLDGYDEVDPLDQAQKEIASQLQEYPYWILTSRPYAAQEIKADATIENVGFTSETIEHYIYNALPLKQKEKAGLIIQKIRQNPIVFGLCHIPINLELVFTIFEKSILDEKEANSFSIHSMTHLYQILTRSLQKRFLKRVSNDDFLEMKDEAIDEELKMNKTYSRIFKFLEATAWLGFKNKKLSFSYKNGDLKELYRKFRPEKVLEQEQFRKNIQESGFIQSFGDTYSFLECKFSFLHLTFQEFFAARYLVRLFKSKDERKTLEAAQLIRDIKFDPRYKIVLWFIAGLLKKDKKHLNSFFDLLGNSEEMVGPYCTLLKVRCLEECGWSKKIKKIKKYKKEIEFWCKQIKNVWMGRIFEQFMVETFEISPISTKKILSPVLNSICKKKDVQSILMYYSSIYLLADPKMIIPKLIENVDSRSGHWTARVLGQIGRRDIENSLPILKKTLKQSPSDIRQLIINSLIEIGQIHLQSVLPLLKETLKDEDDAVRGATIRALGSLEKNDPKIIYPILEEAFIEAFKEGNQDLTCEIIQALCQTTQVNSPTIFSFLKTWLEKDESVIELAISLLGNIHSEPALILLIELSTEQKGWLREKIAIAIGQIGYINPPSSLELLAQFIDNESDDLTLNAIKAIGQMGQSHPIPSLDLLKKFIDNNTQYIDELESVNEGIPELQNKNEKISESINNLNETDKKYFKKKCLSCNSILIPHVVTSIGKIGAKSPEQAIELLNQILEYKESDISRRVLITLGRIAQAAPPYSIALIKSLQQFFLNEEENDDIRGGAAIGLALACKKNPQIIISFFKKAIEQVNSEYMVKDIINALSLFQGVDLQFLLPSIVKLNFKKNAIIEQMDWSLCPEVCAEDFCSITMTESPYSSLSIALPHQRILSRTPLSLLVENYCKQPHDQPDYLLAITMKCLEENRVIFFDDNALCFYENDKMHRVESLPNWPIDNLLDEKSIEESENSQLIPLIEKKKYGSFSKKNSKSDIFDMSNSSAKDRMEFLRKEMYLNFLNNYEKKISMKLHSPLEAEDMLNDEPSYSSKDCCTIL